MSDQSPGLDEVSVLPHSAAAGAEHTCNGEARPDRTETPRTQRPASVPGRTQFRLLLYLMSVLTDFAGFVVVFTVSRGFAEAGAGSLYLGIAGAGLSFTAGAGSLLGGWLAYRFDGRVVFVCGALGVILSIVACALLDNHRLWFLPGYW